MSTFHKLGPAWSDYQDCVLADAPLSYWRLGEASGSTAVDVQGVNDGTYTGGVTLGEAGALSGDPDTAALFDGSSGYVSVASAASLNFGTTAPFTMEAWIKTSSAALYQIIFEKFDGTNGYYFYLYNGAKLYVQIGGNGTFYGGGGAALNDGQWHHVAVSISRGINALVYVDGSLSQTLDISANTQSTSTTVPLVLGYDGYYHSSDFAGTLDEVAIYPAALSAAQIAAHYNAGKAAFGPVPDLAVEIDTTNDPTSATRTWTDITSKVRQLSYQRDGRSQELQRTEAGTLSALLDNRDGSWPPAKWTCWIRVSGRFAGTTKVRWTGLVERWRRTWPSAGKDSLVEITASTPSKILNLFDLDGSSFSSEATDQRVKSVCDVAGLSYTLKDSGLATCAASGTLSSGSMALAHLQDVERTETGFVFANEDGNVEFQSRHYRVGRVLAGVVATFGEAAGKVAYQDTAEYDYDDAFLWNRALVTPDGGTAQVATDANSETSHFTRTLAARQSLDASTADALATAQYLVHRYGAPSQRLPELDVELARLGPGTLVGTMLALRNSDYVLFERNDPAAAVSAHAFVERIAEQVGPGPTWKATLLLSPASDEIPWMAADATYGLAGQTTIGGF